MRKSETYAIHFAHALADVTSPVLFLMNGNAVFTLFDYFLQDFLQRLRHSGRHPKEVHLSPIFEIK